MLYALLCVVTLVPAAVATLLEHVGGPLRLAERHHSHHDTYIVSPDFTRALVIAMLLMGCMGVMLVAFCLVGAIRTSFLPVLCFTDAFVYALFFIWLVLIRYKVALFDDYAVVTPLLGPDEWVFYSDILRIEWRGVRRRTGYRDLLLVTRSRSVRVRGIVDIEQVLLHVDRFDVLAPLGGPAEGPLEIMAQRMRAQDERRAILALGNHTDEETRWDDD